MKENIQKLFEEAEKNLEILETFKSEDVKILLENVLQERRKEQTPLDEIEMDSVLNPLPIVEVLYYKDSLDDVDSDILVGSIITFNKLIELLKQFKPLIPKVKEEIKYYPRKD